MSALDELFAGGPVPPELLACNWTTTEESLLRSILQVRGIHTDELQAYNAYFDEIEQIVLQHARITYTDEHDKMHTLRVTSCYFVRPFEAHHGLDDPDRALLRGDYEATVRGTVVYTIHGRRDDSAADSHFASTNRDAYTVLEYTQTVHDNLIMMMPVMIGTRLCSIREPFTNPSIHANPCLSVPVYCISHTYKQMPYEEYLVNNRVLALRPSVVEIRSRFYDDSKKYRTNSTLKISISYAKCRQYEGWMQPQRFLVEIPHETPKSYIPATLLALAFGWSPAEFVAAVDASVSAVEPHLLSMFLDTLRTDTEGCETTDAALLHIGKRLGNCRSMSNPDDVRSYVAFTMRSEFLPNLVGTDPDSERLCKGYAVVLSVAELIHQSEMRSEDKRWAPMDKRSYVLKRVDTPGEKITSLTRKYVKQYTKKGLYRMKTNLQKGKRLEIAQILNSNTIKLTSSVKNGIWDSRADAADSNQNKTQMMTTGFCSDSLHMQTQKIIKYAMKKNMNPEPLLTHPTQVGRVGLYLTPETEKCGIIRHKANGCSISPLVDTRTLEALVRSVIGRHADTIGWTPLTNTAPLDRSVYTLVFGIRGEVIGWVARPLELYTVFRSLRRTGRVTPYFNMEYDQLRNHFFFNCDPGRMVRPLVVLENAARLLADVRSGILGCCTDPVAYLTQNGLVEYLDAGEEYSGLVLTAQSLESAVASGMEQTHLEVHGAFSLSLSVSRAYATFNSGPRRIYTGAMENRSISRKARPDGGTTSSYSLWYGQDPLQSEVVDQALGLRHAEPNGLNLNVAILSMGDNQEDAWVIKKEAIERGVGVTSEYYVVSLSLGRGTLFQKPVPGMQGMASPDLYAHLRDDGTPIVGARLEGGSAVIGRVFTARNGKVGRCASKFLPWHTAYTVHEVHAFPDRESPAFVRVTLVKTNHPVVGDKFHLAHGQKGTCGRIVPAMDLPFVAAGLNKGTSPDVVINVCSLIRVTQGLLLEMLTGKARALSPSAISQYETLFLGARTFRERLAVTRRVLRAYGLNYTGTDHMLCGKTGRPIKCAVFNGTAYLRVLKHMARDKLRSRVRGPTNELTRQTSVGKRHFGGQKAGEMENWNFHCHGMPYMFSNVNYECADKFIAYQCTRCSIPAIGGRDTGLYLCSMCLQSDCIVRLKVPYITSLAFQEMYAAGWGHTLVSSVEPYPSLVDDDLATSAAALTLVDPAPARDAFAKRGRYPEQAPPGRKKGRG